MEEVIRLNECDADFINEVADAGGKNVQLCFQCGTCSGGCPTAYAMDYTPRQIVTMVNLGMRDEVLKSNTIWVCSSCYTCTTRCPRGVEITNVMAALKSIALKRGVAVKNKRAPAFYKTFVEVAGTYGRLFEPLFLLKFTLKGEDSLTSSIARLIKEAPFGLELAKKGKLALTPSRVKNLQEIKEIYERSMVKKATPEEGK